VIAFALAAAAAPRAIFSLSFALESGSCSEAATEHGRHWTIASDEMHRVSQDCVLHSMVFDSRFSLESGSASDLRFCPDASITHTHSRDESRVSQDCVLNWLTSCSTWGNSRGFQAKPASLPVMYPVESSSSRFCRLFSSCPVILAFAIQKKQRYLSHSGIMRTRIHEIKF
jgi:hypothetical protein